MTLMFLNSDAGHTPFFTCFSKTTPSLCCRVAPVIFLSVGEENPLISIP